MVFKVLKISRKGATKETRRLVEHCTPYADGALLHLTSSSYRFLNDKVVPVKYGRGSTKINKISKMVRIHTFVEVCILCPAISCFLSGVSSSKPDVLTYSAATPASQVSPPVSGQHYAVAKSWTWLS